MYNDYEYHYHRESSLRHKFKSSIACFSTPIHAHHQPLDSADDTTMLMTPPPPPPPPIWYKKSCQDSPDSYRFRCRRFISRMGRKHRQTQSAEFSYDPSSYALNFEDESRTEHEEFPFRNITSRLPPPPPLSPSLLSDPPVRQTVAYS